MPAPLHIPPTVTVFPPISTVHATCLFLVSVVIIASAASVPASLVESRSSGSALIPAHILSIGSCIPITPVEPKSTDLAGTPSTSAAVFASSAQASSPSVPVHALATPLLTTIACAPSSLYTMLLSHFTGAANTLLSVNVPAVTHGFSENTIAISFLPFLYLIPAAIPAALKPLAAVTPPSIISIITTSEFQYVLLILLLHFRNFSFQVAFATCIHRIAPAIRCIIMGT